MRASVFTTLSYLLFSLSQQAQLLISLSVVSSSTSTEMPEDNQLSSIGMYQGISSNAIFTPWMAKNSEGNFIGVGYQQPSGNANAANMVIMSIDEDGHLLNKKSFGPSNGNYLSQNLIKNNDMHTAGRWLNNTTYRPLILNSDALTLEIKQALMIVGTSGNINAAQLKENSEGKLVYFTFPSSGASTVAILNAQKTAIETAFSVSPPNGGSFSCMSVGLNQTYWFGWGENSKAIFSKISVENGVAYHEFTRVYAGAQTSASVFTYILVRGNVAYIVGNLSGDFIVTAVNEENGNELWTFNYGGTGSEVAAHVTYSEQNDELIISGGAMTTPNGRQGSAFFTLDAQTGQLKKRNIIYGVGHSLTYMTHLNDDGTISAISRTSAYSNGFFQPGYLKIKSDLSVDEEILAPYFSTFDPSSSMSVRQTITITNSTCTLTPLTLGLEDITAQVTENIGFTLNNVYQATATHEPTSFPTSQPSKAPTGQPTKQPTSNPSTQPTGQPTAQPTKNPYRFPTGQPTAKPSGQPTGQPSKRPSGQPTGQPSKRPSAQPTGQPSKRPSGQPTGQPSKRPSGQPTGQPSKRPSGQPTGQPSKRPSGQPTGQPSKRPSGQPTGQPSKRPSGQPTGQPSKRPSGQPTGQPSKRPSAQPTGQPSKRPSGQPTGQPSKRPSGQPTGQPSKRPSGQPTGQPSKRPSAQPTGQPSKRPSGQPTGQPSKRPSGQPTGQPSKRPSGQPTGQPSKRPSGQPTGQPSKRPSGQPTGQPSKRPSGQPTGQPSKRPSGQPTGQPSKRPSGQPTGQPSKRPSGQPTGQPSLRPSGQPTGQPTGRPSGQPTGQPTLRPSGQPTRQPTGRPSGQPTAQPSIWPTSWPTIWPTSRPSGQPTGQPSLRPSGQPTGQPTGRPSGQPTGQPSLRPSGQPTRQPTGRPSGQPTAQPSIWPTSWPTIWPTSRPSGQPTGQPSLRPSGQPTGQPTGRPSGQPTGQPSLRPSGQPTRQPTGRPSGQPTGQPSLRPSGQPTAQPSIWPTSWPTIWPTSRPSGQPTGQPTGRPSGQPTAQPSIWPTSWPTIWPTSRPSGQPTGQPTGRPSGQPTAQPSIRPTSWPTIWPTSRPSSQPTGQPTGRPSGQPTGQPTGRPSGQPTGQPSIWPTLRPSSQPTAQPSGQPTASPSRSDSQPTNSQIPLIAAFAAVGAVLMGLIFYFRKRIWDKLTGVSKVGEAPGLVHDEEIALKPSEIQAKSNPSYAKRILLWCLTFFSNKKEDAPVSNNRVWARRSAGIAGSLTRFNQPPHPSATPATSDISSTPATSGISSTPVITSNDVASGCKPDPEQSQFLVKSSRQTDRRKGHYGLMDFLGSSSPNALEIGVNSGSDSDETNADNRSVSSYVSESDLEQGQPSAQYSLRQRKARQGYKAWFSSSEDSIETDTDDVEFQQPIEVVDLNPIYADLTEEGSSRENSDDTLSYMTAEDELDLLIANDEGKLPAKAWVYLKTKNLSQDDKNFLITELLNLPLEERNIETIKKIVSENDDYESNPELVEEVEQLIESFYASLTEKEKHCFDALPTNFKNSLGKLSEEPRRTMIRRLSVLSTEQQASYLIGVQDSEESLEKLLEQLKEHEIEENKAASGQNSSRSSSEDEQPSAVEGSSSHDESDSSDDSSDEEEYSIIPKMISRFWTPHKDQRKNSSTPRKNSILSRFFTSPQSSANTQKDIESVPQRRQSMIYTFLGGRQQSTRVRPAEPPEQDKPGL